jgi:hypothetical protein
MSKPIEVGDVIHGHAGGWFGRDHYSCGRVEAMGSDWLILRTYSGAPVATVQTRNPVGMFVALTEARDVFDPNYCSIGCPNERGQ